MATVFFYGTLRHRALRSIVIGRDVPVEPAFLPGFHAVMGDDASHPVLVADGTGATGVLARNLSDTELARLAFYIGGQTFAERKVLL